MGSYANEMLIGGCRWSLKGSWGDLGGVYANEVCGRVLCEGSLCK